jgi:hypothetical protein
MREIEAYLTSASSIEMVFSKMDGASQKKCRQQVPKPFWPKQTAHSFFW